MSLQHLLEKKRKLVIGLMGGTSADGVDAALVQIDGYGSETKVKQMGYVSIPFEDAVRERILKISQGDFGGSRELARMNALLGQLYMEACTRLCRVAEIPFE